MNSISRVPELNVETDQAVLFADEAIRLGQASPADGSLDPSTMLELKRFRLQLKPPSGPAA